MRQIRTSGSEGGEAAIKAVFPTPIHHANIMPDAGPSNRRVATAITWTGSWMPPNPRNP